MRPCVRRRLFLMFAGFFFLWMPAAWSQKTRYTISGYIRDSTSGEMLPGANIFVKEINTGTSSNLYGFYSLTLPEGKYTLLFQYAGYTTQEKIVQLHADITYDIEAGSAVMQYEEVVVTAPAAEENVKSTEMGKVEIESESIKKLPVLMGETDLLKTLQLQPGIQAAGEGNTGIYVRGGGPDQNLVLLDGAVVYNTGHLFGFFSVFNTDAIKNVTLYKGNMPANFGGRISSVLDFVMKEGNNKTFHASGGAGLIASRLTVEGPLQKNKSAFIISGRRTYIDQLSKLLYEKDGVKGLPYYFYDVNVKANYVLSQKDKVYLSFYSGKDDVILRLLDGRLDSRIAWGNNTATLRWNHLFSGKLFLNTSMLYNSYRFLSTARFDNFNTQVDSRIYDYSARLDFDYYHSPVHSVRFGYNYTFHTFVPRRIDASASGTEFNKSKDTEKYAHDMSWYISDDMEVSSRIRITAGIRFNLFQQTGPYSYLQSSGSVMDTVHYGKLKAVKTFFNPEPRIGIRYALNAVSSLKTAFNINNQYVHLVSLSGNALPFDIWVPSSRLISPQKGWQYSIGYFRNLSHNMYEVSVEAYYKELRNLIEYRQDYVPVISGELESEFVFGRGASYGVEFLVKKNLGKFQGWIGYTLARAYRKFPDINDGNTFPARYDRRHDVSIVGTYELNSRWTLGGTFVFATGQAITLPERRYFIEGTIYNQYGPRNGFRMQPYHRLDISATYQKRKPGSRFESSWTFAIYNVYNRKNPYLYFIDAKGDVSKGNLSVQAKKLYLFPILPSITWNFKF
jgi:hypothetical protein